MLKIAVLLFSFFWSSIFLFTQGHTYELSTNIIDRDEYPLVVSSCDATTWECDDAVQPIPGSLDPYAQEIYTLLIDADPFWRQRMVTYIEHTSEQLKDKERRYSGKTTVFFMQYMRMVLDDIIQRVQYEYDTITIDKETFALLKEESENKKVFAESLRTEIIKGLIQAGYAGFSSDNYVSTSGKLTTATGDWQDWSLDTTIIAKDILDNYVYDITRDPKAKDVVLPPDVWSSWNDIALFKKEKDLEDLGYLVISHRERVNTDVAYRRENIFRALTHIGHIRVLNPGQTLSYLNDIEFDPELEENYLEGKVIALDQEVDEYGGGLCGGSTAIYQGTFLNTALEFQVRNHSKWYSHLYTSTINGEEQTIPGIDSTIYAPYLDLKIKNTAAYPIVLVMNYDGSYEGREEIFTMGPNHNDRGIYQYTSMEPKKFKIHTEDGGTKTVTGGCYTRRINGKEENRCYKEIF